MHNSAPRVAISSLLLAKRGFDMRAYYDRLLDEPFPAEISRPLWALASRDDQAINAG